VTKGKQPFKKPPGASIQSVQYDLFTTFLTNGQGAVSNALEVWDGIPKYFLTPAQQEKLRTERGHADPYDWEYIYDGKPCKVRLQPALIEQKDGSFQAYFPSTTEELVEEALKKFLTDQQHGFHDLEKAESWVKFSLGMLSKELKMRGRARDRNEIKLAIAVLSGCILTLSQDGKEVYKGAILSDLVTVNRDKYLEDSKSLHAARLPVFVSHGINTMQYRQFNYGRLMDCNEQVTRWLFKRLVHRYSYASLMDTYHFLYSDVQQGSGLLQQVKESDNRRKVCSSLKELQNKGVLLSYIAKNIKDRRKIKDVKYVVTAAPEFVREQKAANKRASQNLDEAHRLRLVDKFG
jgi:hypothetical protein